MHKTHQAQAQTKAQMLRYEDELARKRMEVRHPLTSQGGMYRCPCHCTPRLLGAPLPLATPPTPSLCHL
eukprot:8804119-Pyramimonas_sp.AAC.2